MPEALNTIIQKAQKGDSSSFSKLVEKYQQYAFRLAFRILCEEEEAQDIVQESFIKIWKKLREFDPTRQFTTWMYSIVTNSAIDRLRSIKRRNHVSIDDVHKELGVLASDNPTMKMDNREIAQVIQFLASELPEKQRLVFVLRDLQEISSKETQEILNESEVVVKSNLYLARKAIKEKLNKILEFERR